jgi:hypothetical protein
MMRHLLRIVWNRRRTNLLIAIELFLSFLVLAWVATFGVFFLDNYARPLGFTYDNVWSVRISMHAADMELTPLTSSPSSRRPPANARESPRSCDCCGTCPMWPRRRRR